MLPADGDEVEYDRPLIATRLRRGMPGLRLPSGTASHRDAQIRHALTRVVNWAGRVGVAAIGIEDLDFTTEKTREKHGRRKRFRQLISGIPTGRFKARLVSMAAEHGPSIVAGRSRLHLAVGCPALAEAAGNPLPRHVPSQCRRYRDRATRPRAPAPATGGTAPARPQRSCVPDAAPQAGLSKHALGRTR
jgi:hypothetical protein